MTFQGTSVRSLRAFVTQTLSISTLLGLAFLSPALADDDDNGGKAGNAIKAADVGVKVVGGLATWIQGQGDDCSVAGAVGVSGCECGFKKEECQAAAPVSLGIYDVAGRQIALLLDRELGAGGHQVTWDGTTTGGTEAQAGVYYAVLRASGERQLRRLVLTR